MYNPRYPPSNVPLQTHPQAQYEYGPLELGGMTYQYFIVDMAKPAMLGPDGSPIQNPRSPTIMMPIAGPFLTFSEACQCMEKLLHGNVTVVILPVHMFQSNHGIR